MVKKVQPLSFLEFLSSQGRQTSGQACKCRVVLQTGEHWVPLEDTGEHLTSSWEFEEGLPGPGDIRIRSGAQGRSLGAR